MNKNISLYDKINFFDLPNIICEMAKASKNNHINSREEIVNMVFHSLYLRFKGDYLTKHTSFLKKYSSSDTPKSNDELDYIVDAINDNCNESSEILESIKNGCKNLASEISTLNNSEELYETLFVNCNYINLGESILDVEALYKKDDHSLKSKGDFLYILFLHAIKNYKTNMPKFYCDRLYQEALTLYHGSEMQKKIFKEISDICDNNQLKSTVACEASIQYANLIYSNHVEAFKYFSRATAKLPSAYWEIAFLIENHHLPSDIVLDFEKRINQLFDSELENISIITKEAVNVSLKQNLIICPETYDDSRQELDTLVSFKIYWVTAKRYSFTKCLNSVGKLLITNKLSVFRFNNGHLFIDEDRSLDLANKYLNKSMRLGNTNAIVNLGYYLFQRYKNGLLDDDSKNKMLQLLYNAADNFSEPTACSLLGDYFFMNNNYEKAQLYYNVFIKQNSNNGYGYYQLAKIESLSQNYDVALELYEKAISSGYYDAAYECAEIWYQKSLSINCEKNMSIPFLHIAKQYLDKYLKTFSYEYQINAIKLLKIIKTILSES